MVLITSSRDAAMEGTDPLVDWNVERRFVSHKSLSRLIVTMSWGTAIVSAYVEFWEVT